MISALHLIWIIPVAFAVGYMFCALLSINTLEEKIVKKGVNKNE